MQNNRSKLLEWINCGAIPTADVARAVQVAQAQPSKLDWLRFAQQACSWLALIAFACGVIFFFAYNWQAMSRFTKFSLVEGALLLSALLYIRLASSAVLRPAILSTVTLLIGALLALVGQAYQTGADPWQLFAVWSLFALPLALLARSCIVWIFWVVLLNTALLLYLEISRHLLWFSINSRQFHWVICAFNSTLLIIFELIAYYSRRGAFLSNRYTQQALATIAGVSISMWALANIDSYHSQSSALFYYMAWLVSIVIAYRLLIKDSYILAASALSFIIVSTVYLFDAFDGTRNEGAMLLLSLYIISCSSAAVYWLKKLSREATQPPVNHTVHSDSPVRGDSDE